MHVIRRPVWSLPRGRGEPPSAVARGHIARLCIGQGCGSIRMTDGRDIWFHRGDMDERAAFNRFVVGDSVMFDLLEDRISGARALRVRRDHCQQ